MISSADNWVHYTKKVLKSTKIVQLNPKYRNTISNLYSENFISGDIRDNDIIGSQAIDLIRADTIKLEVWFLNPFLEGWSYYKSAALQIMEIISR